MTLILIKFKDKKNRTSRPGAKATYNVSKCRYTRMRFRQTKIFKKIKNCFVQVNHKFIKSLTLLQKSLFSLKNACERFMNLNGVLK